MILTKNGSISKCKRMISDASNKTNVPSKFKASLEFS